MRDNSSILPLLSTIGPFNEVPDEYNYQDSLESLKQVKSWLLELGD